MDISVLTQEIQSIVAPGVLISCSALLLLGFQTKFSNIANRFRLLNQEEQILNEQTNRSANQEIRFSNLKLQIEYLFRRSRLLRNAILMAYLCILFFVGTSILILCSTYSSWDLRIMIISVFSLGLFTLFTAIMIMIIETNLFFEVIHLEKKSRTFSDGTPKK